MSDEASEVGSQITAGSSTLNTTGNTEILKRVAAELYSSPHISTDDIGVRLENLEAYLKKVDGE